MRRRVGASRAAAIVGLCAVAIACATATVPAVTGCNTHQCDASSYAYTGGRMVDENTYETNAIEEPWLDYPPNVTVMVQVPFGRMPDSVDVYVGVTNDGTHQPNGPGNNWTLASGQLAEVALVSNFGFWVINGTCAAYAARFVAHFPMAPEAGMDASADRAADSAQE